MYCDKCGRDIGNEKKCPFCDAEQHNVDPFTTLGDIESNQSGRTGAPVNKPIIPAAKPDCFSVLGDLEPSGEGSVTQEEATHRDKPATGGFKPMDEIVSTKRKHIGREFDKEPKKIDLAKNFVWKKWMTVTVSIIFIFIIHIASTSNWRTQLSTSQAETIIRDELMIVMNYENNTNNPIISTLVEGLEIDVNSVEKKGSEYILECTFRNYDITTAFAITNQQAGEITLTDYMNILTQAMKSTDKIENTLTVSVPYLQGYDGYKVQLTEYHLDAAMGGFISAVTQ